MGLSHYYNASYLIITQKVDEYSGSSTFVFTLFVKELVISLFALMP